MGKIKKELILLLTTADRQKRDREGKSIISYFLSYILFYLWVLPNLYPSFCPSLPRILSRMVSTLGYFRILLHRLFLGIIILITFGYYHIDYFWGLVW